MPLRCWPHVPIYPADIPDPDNAGFSFRSVLGPALSGAPRRRPGGRSSQAISPSTSKATSVPTTFSLAPKRPTHEVPD
jgi:hypothetical protein